LLEAHSITKAIAPFRDSHRPIAYTEIPLLGREICSYFGDSFFFISMADSMAGAVERHPW
jgi:hypothetical protein